MLLTPRFFRFHLDEGSSFILMHIRVYQDEHSVFIKMNGNAHLDEKNFSSRWDFLRAVCREFQADVMQDAVEKDGKIYNSRQMEKQINLHLYYA